jgi:hypothetical protein
VRKIMWEWGLLGGREGEYCEEISSAGGRGYFEGSFQGFVEIESSFK